MITKFTRKSLYFIGFCLILGTSHASDTEKEKRWADQVVDSLMVGEATYLQAGKDKFLALYTEHTTKDIQGGAIVIHGVGVHPNWDQIIRPVRSQLPEYGWSTLSIQMPILANDAKLEEYAAVFDEVAPRINAAVKFLKNRNINNIVIVAHSLGTAMAAYYLRNNPDPSIKGMVAIGATGSHFKNENKNYLKSLTTIKLPIVDIYGAVDEPDVIKTAEQKVAIARKSGNKNYTQIKVAGADHFFTNMQEELIKRIRDWLAKNIVTK